MAKIGRPPTQRHPGKKRGGISATKRKYAKAKANGANTREACEIAGLTSKRALLGITGADWMREDPGYRALLQHYTENQIVPAEISGRLAVEAATAMDAKDRIRALDILGHHAGMRKTNLNLNTGTLADLSGLTEDELAKLEALAEKAKRNASGQADGAKGA